jgi:tetratricopeptide (TPR) repeat protein
MITLLFAAAMFTTTPQFSSTDARTAAGFDHFYNLEYNQSIEEFRRLIAIEPDNPAFHNHLAQAVLYREMLRGGALESELVSGSNPFLNRPKLNTTPEAQREFESSLNKSMKLVEARLAKDPNDIGALYAQGVAYALSANYNFLVRKAWIDSLKDATAARKAHNRVIELNPALVDARLIQGVHDYILGSLPFTIKILGFLGGFHGDRDSGMKALQLVAEKGSANKYDAQVLLAAIYRREKKPEQALPLLANVIARFPRNYLFRLETVQMYSDLGDKQKALSGLDTIEQLKRAGSPGFASLPIQKVHYYRGNLLFWYRELDRALQEMTKATSGANQLDVHTALLAWMRLGQINDTKGRRHEAMTAYRQAMAIAPESDVGKESKQYLNSPYKRRDS